jgi:hypothetical protein
MNNANRPQRVAKSLILVRSLFISYYKVSDPKHKCYAYNAIIFRLFPPYCLKLTLH